MNQLTLALPDELYSRLAQYASVKEKTPEEIALERLRREFGEGFLDSQTAKERAITILASALYIILSGNFDEGSQKWAYGAAGSIIGYWLKSPSA